MAILKGVLQGFFPGGGPRVPGAGSHVVQARGPVQRAGNAMALPASFSLPTTWGQRMSQTVQRQMETHFKTDFSSVRVHVGAHVTALGALAFTLGDQIHFAPGYYQPETPRGQRLLGHELTHVVQQRSGRVRNPFNSGIVLVQDAALEAEAERMGLRVSTARPIPGAPVPGARLPRAVVVPASGRFLQRMSRTEIRNQATFLNTTTTNLFTATKPGDGKLMEVQSAIFDGKMYVASNYTRGNDDTTLASAMVASYQQGGVTYTRGSLLRIAGTLHAEQQILDRLAAVLANPNKTLPSHVTVIGSKRPCSICRRVLLAFRKGLVTHYPGVNLHFVNQTGQDTDPRTVESLDLDAMAVGKDERFKAFAVTYKAELAKLAGQRLSGEEVSNATRTNALPDVAELI